MGDIHEEDLDRGTCTGRSGRQPCHPDCYALPVAAAGQYPPQKKKS